MTGGGTIFEYSCLSQEFWSRVNRCNEFGSVVVGLDNLSDQSVLSQRQHTGTTREEDHIERARINFAQRLIRLKTNAVATFDLLRIAHRYHDRFNPRSSQYIRGRPTLRLPQCRQIR